MFKTRQGVIKPIVYVGMINKDRLLVVDYKVAPNPNRAGWWIPAPGLDFGQSPLEKAQSLVSELGFESSKIRFKDIESFTSPGGWHLIFHYVCGVSGEPKPNENIKAYRWVTSCQLEEVKLAHGSWEADVGRSYLLGGRSI